MSLPRGSIYDLCVVGAGPVGSATALHASATPGVKVCLVGPNEPKVRVPATGKEIFGAHYDNGRITLTVDEDPVWSHIYKKSQERYRELEYLSGINFYSNVGTVIIGDQKCLEGLETVSKEGVVKMSQAEMSKRYPYLKFGDTDIGLFNKDGGVVNPRAQIDASISVASKQGCEVIRDVVCDVLETKYSSEKILMVKTEGGKRLYARKVLLATNSFTHSRNLLDGVKVKFTASPQTVVLAEVDGEDLDTLRHMPSVGYNGPGSPEWYTDYPRDPSGLINYYMLPPVLYPDGKYYLKIGHSDGILKEFLRHEDISNWHCSGGDPWIIDCLTKLLKSMFTGIEFKSFHSDSCVTMVTPTSRPYIEKISDQIGVAIGGNGYAAKCSHEIGLIAAQMMLSTEWNYEIPQNAFKLICDTEGKATAKL